MMEVCSVDGDGGEREREVESVDWRGNAEKVSLAGVIEYKQGKKSG